MSLDGEMHGHTHAHSTGHRWADMVVAFSALFVSVVSLGVAIGHGRTMDRLVSANSWPMLQYSWGVKTFDGRPALGMAVVNSGVGPAKIEAAELVWRGVAYRTNVDFLRACCGLKTEDGVVGSLVPNEVLRAGEPINFLTFVTSADPKVEAALDQVLLGHDLRLNLCYCSIFGECWKNDVATINLNPTPVRECAQPKVPFDQRLLGS